MLAYVLLQVLGPSMLPAILALTIHNAGIIGYLMGRHADALAYRADAPAASTSTPTRPCRGSTASSWPTCSTAGS